MTNAEKYGMDEDEVNELTDKFEEWHKNNTDVRGYGEALFRFLQAEVKPTLSEDEKVILRNLPKDADSIGRDSDGELEIKMINQNNCNDFGYDWFGWYDKLFQFIKPRRRI